MICPSFGVISTAKLSRSKLNSHSGSVSSRSSMSDLHRFNVFLNILWYSSLSGACSLSIFSLRFDP